MKNFFDKFKKKPEENENTEKTSVSIDMNIFLKEEGKILYLPQNFDFEAMRKALCNWLEAEKNLKIEFVDNKEYITIFYKETTGFKSTLGLSLEFGLHIKKEEEKLFYWIKPRSKDNIDSDFRKKAQKQIGSLIKDNFEDDIVNYLSDFIINRALFNTNKDKIEDGNRYLEKLPINEQLWYYHKIEENEIILANLAISQIKQLPENKEINTKADWRFWITNSNTWITAISERGEIIYFDNFPKINIEVKDEIGRDPVKSDDYEWLTNLNNDYLFREVQNTISLDSQNRIREFARLNWINHEKDKNSNHFAFYLLKKLKENSQNPFDKLSSLFVELAVKDRKSVISNTENQENLLEVLTEILNYENTAEELKTWTTNWHISYFDSLALVQLLVKIAQTSHQKAKFLSYYTDVREVFFNKNKDEISKSAFDIAYCKTLIACEEKEKAAEICKEQLNKLPDETLADLLPSEEIALSDTVGGQVLKISFLDLLNKAESSKEKEIILQTAKLQPLSLVRIENLIEKCDGEIISKGEEIRTILKGSPTSLETENNFENKTIKKLSEEKTENLLQHPASRKEGVFSSLETWLATVEIPDYSILREYAELLSPINYPEINDLFTDIKYAFNLENVQTYIARGEKNVGVTAFEGNPSFVLLGAEHLKEDSPYYLELPELRFAFGEELAHLYFKHSRVTSNDVWKGAKDKGFMVIDAVLNILPGIGLLGKAISGVGKLNAVASILQKASKIENIAGKGKELFDVTTQAVGVYKDWSKKESKEKEKEQELIAASRVMQLTADRAGLLFSQNIWASIKAIFLTSKQYQTEFEKVKKYGLSEFILQKNEQQQFKHQELAIRFAALFSFYLSDEFKELSKILYEIKE